MGSSNSTNITNYINNSTDIKASVTSSVTATSTVSSNSNASNVVNFSVGGSDCCVAFANPPPRPPDTSDAVYVALIDAQKEKFATCEENAKNSVAHCDLKINQTGSSTIRISSVVTAKSNQELINSVINTMKTDIDNLVKQNNDSGILSDIFGEDNMSNISTTITNSFKTSLSTSLTQTVQSNLRSVSGQENTAKVSLCGGVMDGKDCEINQENSINVYVKNILGSIASAAVDNEEVVKFATAVKTASKQENTNFLSDFVNSLSAMEKVIIIGIVVIVLAAMVFGLVIMVRKKSHHKDGRSYHPSGADYSVGHLPDRSASVPYDIKGLRGYRQPSLFD